jgi:hypothetical protein
MISPLRPGKPTEDRSLRDGTSGNARFLGRTAAITTPSMTSHIARHSRSISQVARNLSTQVSVLMRATVINMWIAFFHPFILITRLLSSRAPFLARREFHIQTRMGVNSTELVSNASRLEFCPAQRGYSLFDLKVH